MDDTPGDYEEAVLCRLLSTYLSEDRTTPRRIRDILLPLCLEHPSVDRDKIKKELVDRGEAADEGRAGTVLTTISRELGIKRRDYLRQVIRYDKTSEKEKDNYRIEGEYKDMVRRVLESLRTDAEITRGKMQNAGST